jgi:hypothetical protein
MNEDRETNLPRFVVRRGALKDTWMVWDRKTQRPARMYQGVAAGLTEEQARGISDLLIRDYEGLKPRR